MAAAGAWEMLALNLRTINLVSGVCLALAWLLAGAGVGALVGVLGGRAFQAFRRRGDDGAAFLATITVGHLLLPLGSGPVIALIPLVTRPLRRRFLPRRARIDQGILLALAFHVADRATPSASTLPPEVPRSAAVAATTPAPTSLPVTITVHPAAPFPEVPAVHIRLRPLASERLGREAALWTGRLPVRTGAGPSTPRRIPGGGGISRIPERTGSRALAALFPRAKALEGPFAPVGRIEDLARSAGVAVLRVPPSPSDPPLYLRILELSTAPSPGLAEELAAQGAWLDVTLGVSPEDQLALAGRGIATTRAATEATLLDVTPTALHILGLAVPRDCDGRVLMERLAVPGPGARAPRYRTLAPDSAGRKAAAAPVSDSTTSR